MRPTPPTPGATVPSSSRPVAALAALLAVASAGAPLGGQDPGAPPASGADGPSAAFLFTYELEQGEEGRFEEGYRRHLDWHAGRDDPLVWYGWYIVTGPRVGLFVDGTFGLGFEDFENRPAPAEDRADFARTAAPFATPVRRGVYLLREDLGTATPLERRKPPPMLQVARFRVSPGREAEFESRMRGGVERLRKREPVPALVCYERVDGGPVPTYVVMVSLSGFSALATDRLRPGELLDERPGPGAGGGSLADVVTSVRSELWLYRDDLSYFPDEP